MNVENVAREIAKLRGLDSALPPSLPPSSSDGNSGGMEPWPSSVERRLGMLDADLRALLKVGVAAVVALAALIGGLYLYTNSKFEAAADRAAVTQLETTRTGGKVDALAQRIDRIDAKLDQILARK